MYLLLLCTLLSLTIVESVSSSDGKIWDPLNVFCGARNCYDVLDVERSANITEISKSYRKLSRSVHPDKVAVGMSAEKKANQTEQFRLIAKAYEVLKGNESRPNFDYYLDHPRDYYTVSGQHIWKALPKSNPIFVIVGFLLLMSWLFHTIQKQKHEKARSKLTDQVRKGARMVEGGTKFSLDKYQKAVKQYEALLKASTKQADKALMPKGYLNVESLKVKAAMLEDSKYTTIVDNIINDIEDWGEYKAPVWQDLFIVKCCMFPVLIYEYAKKYHRRYVSSAPLSLEEQQEMCIEMLGNQTWDSLSEEEKKDAIKRQVWKSSVYSEWLDEKDKKFVKSKKYKRMVRRQAQEDPGDIEFD